MIAQISLQCNPFEFIFQTIGDFLSLHVHFITLGMSISKKNGVSYFFFFFCHFHGGDMEMVDIFTISKHAHRNINCVAIFFFKEENGMNLTRSIHEYVAPCYRDLNVP